ncbi:MAG: tRNA-dihydrouridine synthase [Candidatus Nomurabacteria bacterium]
MIKSEKNFIDKLKDKIKKGKTISVLAPMADVTDYVFREMIAKYSTPHGPDIFWTEFVSADGLASIGAEHLKIDLKFNKTIERPILAQIFGSKKENLKTAINLTYKLGFDGVDINMGCPDKSIEKQNSGSGMIKNPALVRDILKDLKDHIDILKQKRFFSLSVKTRIGYNKIEYEKWFPNILDYEPDIFTIHLRTRKEMSLVEAHWELSEEIVSFVKKYCKDNNLKIPFIILNGDVKNVLDSKEKIKLSGADGVMIGRGVFGTPWLFNEKEYIKRKELDLYTKSGRKNILFRLEVLMEHTKLYEKQLGKVKSFNIMKKHYKAYVNGFDNAKELRIDLMNRKDYKEVKQICEKFIKEKIL